jgi:hypothetical protein
MTAAEQLINDCVSPFNETQRQRLRELSKVMPRGEEYPAVPNKPLEEYIKQMRDLYPEMFHNTKADLDSRVFMDTPSANIPYAHAVRTPAQSPWRNK